MRASIWTFALAALLFGGCDTQEKQNDFADEAGRQPSGYVVTDASGEIQAEDRDDWRTSPLFIGKVRVEPAYPNPISDGFVTVPFSVLDFDQIRGGLVLRGFDPNGRLVRLDDAPEATQPGAYVFTFSPSLLGRLGLHRLFVFDGTGEIVSYGDLMVE